MIHGLDTGFLVAAGVLHPAFNAPMQQSKGEA